MRADRRRIGIGAGAAVALVLLASAPAASAAQHLISVREVYPGSSANPGSEFVELQLYAGSQQFVGGHAVRVYDASGAVTGTYTFPTSVMNGGSQRSILVATAAAQAQFGVSADLTAGAPGMEPSGGAACWDSFDCVSWGTFSGVLPSPAGPPAAPIPDGSSLLRSIAGGSSPSALDAADDTNSSAADFAPCATPTPRNNAAVPNEQPCGTGGGGGGGGGDGGGGGGGGPEPDVQSPQTTFVKRPPNRSTDRTPTFRFTSNEGGSRFQCKLDGRPLRACTSPFTLRRLSFGRHTLRVRAIDQAGNRDPTAAVDTFRVVRRR